MIHAFYTPWIFASSIAAAQNMLPKLLGHCTAAAVVALPVRKLALSTMAQKQQPALLLQDELLLLLPLFGHVGRILLICWDCAIAWHVQCILPLGPCRPRKPRVGQIGHLRDDIAPSDGGAGCSTHANTGHAAAIADAHVVDRDHAIACATQMFSCRPGQCNHHSIAVHGQQCQMQQENASEQGVTSSVKTPSWQYHAHCAIQR